MNDYIAYKICGAVPCFSGALGFAIPLFSSSRLDDCQLYEQNIDKTGLITEFLPVSEVSDSFVRIDARDFFGDTNPLTIGSHGKLLIILGSNKFLCGSRSFLREILNDSLVDYTLTTEEKIDIALTLGLNNLVSAIFDRSKENILPGTQDITDPVIRRRLEAVHFRRQTRAKAERRSRISRDTRSLARQIEQAFSKQELASWIKYVNKIVEHEVIRATEDGYAEALIEVLLAAVRCCISERRSLDSATLSIAEGWVQSALAWAPFREHSWEAWADLYGAVDDIRSQQLILWEGFRRLPEALGLVSRLSEIEFALNGNAFFCASLLESAMAFCSPPDEQSERGPHIYYICQSQIAKFRTIYMKSDEDYYLYDYISQLIYRRGGGDVYKQVLVANYVTKFTKSDNYARLLSKFFTLDGISDKFLGGVVELVLSRVKNSQARFSTAIAIEQFFPYSQYMLRLAAAICCKVNTSESRDAAIRICEKAILFEEDPIVNAMLFTLYALRRRTEDLDKVRLAISPAPKATLAQDEEPVQRALKSALLSPTRLSVARSRLDEATQSALVETIRIAEQSLEDDHLSVVQLQKSVGRFFDLVGTGIKEPLVPPTEARTEVVQTLSPVIAAISINSNLFRLSSGIYFSGNDSNVSQIRKILEENPTFAYAKILAERHQIWNAQADETEFSVAFEQALNQSDLRLLERLEKKFPRRRALCLVARVALGDEVAFSEIAAVLSTPFHTVGREERLMRVGLSNSLRQRLSAEAMWVNADSVKNVLRRVNDTISLS